MNEIRGRRRSEGGDALLVERAKRGDNGAFEALVLKYQQRITRLMQRLVHSPETVEDMAQEVFIRAYRALPDFRGQASFYTWLYKIALNTSRNYYRSLGRRPEGSLDTGGVQEVEEFEAGQRTPEEEAIRAEFWQQVHRSLGTLPREQREAIVFCDLEGLSYDEIADVLGIPIGTVRSRVFRGRKALQERLSPLFGGQISKERAGH